MNFFSNLNNLFSTIIGGIMAIILLGALCIGFLGEYMFRRGETAIVEIAKEARKPENILARQIQREADRERALAAMENYRSDAYDRDLSDATDDDYRDFGRPTTSTDE